MHWFDRRGHGQTRGKYWICQRRAHNNQETCEHHFQISIHGHTVVWLVNYWGYGFIPLTKWTSIFFCPAGPNCWGKKLILKPLNKHLPLLSPSSPNGVHLTCWLEAVLAMICQWWTLFEKDCLVRIYQVSSSGGIKGENKIWFSLNVALLILVLTTTMQFKCIGLQKKSELGMLWYLISTAKKFISFILLCSQWIMIIRLLWPK